MPIPDRLNPTFATTADPTIARELAPAGSADDPLDAARQRLIVGLDVPSREAALALVERLEGQCLWLKVGLELFVAAGPRIVEELAGRGHSIFLDLKFHDIPNTVAGAVRSAATLGAAMINVHAGGGPTMLRAARAALEGIANPPQLLAVTVLTSMDQEQVSAVGLERAPAAQVELLARMSLEAGVGGFVCSPKEVATLRALAGPEALLVVPGIRPAGSDTGDQKRIATPAETIRAGASHLVVGRPITQAAKPAEAAEAVLREIAGALA
jgi:orotidine-5'-phosphate decarboxylase